MMRKKVILPRAALCMSLAAVCAFAQISTRMPEPGKGPPGSPVLKYGYLTATGGKLRGSVSGTTNVQLKGMSFHWSNGGDGGRQMYNENVVAWLDHDWGVDLLRAALAPSADGTNKGFCDGDGPGQETIIRLVIEESIKRGLYVIADFHSHKAENEVSCANGFFQKMVASYGKYPNIIYEIYNEPENQSWETVRTYANNMISTIRTAETGAGVTHSNLIVVGSPRWSSQPHNTPAVTDSKNNVAYALHFYAGSGDHDSYRGNMTSAISAGRTVFATEWGTCHSSGNGGYNSGNSTTWLNQLASNGVSWANWAIANKDETASILNTGRGVGGGWSTSDLTTSGQYMKGQFTSRSSRTYAITLTQPSNAGGSTVTKNPTSASHAYGSSVTITTSPAAGWEFVNWTGDAAGTNATLTAVVRGVPLEIGAEFYNGGIIKNGHFTHNTTSWTPSGNLAAANLSVDNGQLRVNVATPGSAAADARLQQTGVALTENSKYRLTFKARGQSARSLTVNVNNTTGTQIFIDTVIQLGTSMQEYNVEFNYRLASGNNLVRFLCGGSSTVWFLDDLKLVHLGPADPTSVGPYTAVSQRAVWSASGVKGGITLRGPAEHGARLSVYDTRGRVVRSMAAVDGMTLGRGSLPSGNYFLVVRNAAGKDVLRTKVLFAQ